MSAPLLLHVVSGPLAGQRTTLAPGAALVVGRDAGCDWVLADPELSRRHFRVSWDGSRCRVEDLDSTNGTLVDGARADGSEGAPPRTIATGDTAIEISALALDAEPPRPRPPQADQKLPTPGALDVLDHVETIPLPADAPAATPDGVALAKALAGAPAVWAVIDAAAALELVFLARRLGQPAYTLFDGDMAGEVATAGPCLVPVGPRGAFADLWANWLGRSAGVLFEGSADLDTVLGHLRNIFVVCDEEGQEYFFRFYDPRILRAYLPTCRPEELGELFGDAVTAWISEVDEGKGWERHARGGDGILTRPLGSQS